MAAPSDALASIPDQSAQQPAAAQPQPGVWHRVLQGALAGLSEPGMGAVRGALDPTKALQTRAADQQIQQSKVKFANAQAAAEAADAATKDQQLHDLPQEQQDVHNESAEKVVSGYTALFGNPTAIVNNTGDDAMNHLQTLSGAQPGGVDHHIVVNTGGKLYLWNTEAAASSPDAWQFVKAAGNALGIAPLAALTPDSWKALPQQKKIQYMDMSDDLWNTVVPAKDMGTMGGQISRLTTAQQTLQKKVNSDPSLKPLLDNVNRNLQAVQDSKKQFQSDMRGKSNLRAVSGTVNGQPAFGILTANGWVDPDTQQPIPGFKPPKNYAQVAESVANLRNETQTKEKLMPDGVHLFAYNPQTKQFDRDQGLAGTGAQGNRGSAASASIRMGDQLIADIQRSGSKLGTLNAWVQKYGLNTPIADPDLAGLQAELSSFAALQPVQHGFRSTDALKTFEAIIGGLQKNPKATIASIRALSQTSRAINPAAEGKGAAHKAAPAPAAPAGGDFFSKFGGQQRQQ